jgi:hypothetical protein
MTISVAGRMAKAMAGPIDIYYLVRLADPPVGRPSYLLLKLTQDEFANWSQSQEDAAVADVIQRRDQFMTSFLKQTACTDRPATAEVVVEFQGYPIGDVFYEQSDRPVLDIWVAPTRFGSYWIVFGVAESEGAFWEQIAADEDIARLEPIRPAKQVTVHFLNRAERS